ncbi:MAG TPA: heavy metal transporter [Clostridiales bacterium]|nr:heavy metal transporter [Clostridiales bacterium]
MSSNRITETLAVVNMTCVNCENIIERALSRTAGVEHASASYSKGQVTVTFDKSLTSIQEIQRVLEAEGYQVKTQGNLKTNDVKSDTKEKGGVKGNKSEGRDMTDLVGIIIILFALYMVANHFGLFNIFNAFPTAEEGMGYGMLFLIGALTSVHCVAMCGGICLSQCVPAKEGTFIGRFSAMRPSLLYNLGRVVSYTVIGGIVGAVGSVVSFSGTMKGIVQILAGIFMVIMGLNMLNIFPALRRLNPRMPKVFAKKIYAGSSSKGPLYIGLLNGLMPCGPLQAMQLYALSTGSPVKGAISMFLFSAGTVPLMFAFGALSSFLSKKFTAKMLTASAVLVVFLGIFMFNNGVGLSGIVLPTFPASANTKQKANLATVEGDVQVVTSGITSGSYEPIIVQKGIPVKWTIQAEDGELNGCNNSILVQKYSIQKKLQIGDNAIEFTPTESGTVPFSCWMGMIRSKITVVDDLGNIDNSAMADAGSVSSSAGGCCGTGGGSVSSGGSSSSSNSSGANSSGGTASDGGSSAGNGSAGSNSNGLSDYNNLLEPQIPTDELAVAAVDGDGTQKVELVYGEKGFSPAVIVVQAGLETTWNIQGKDVDSSKGTLIFPYYSAQLEMVEGENPIRFIPDQDFEFFSSDGSCYGYVKVVEDINQIDEAAVKKEVSEYTPTGLNGVSAGASCCQ